ncbi:hypothetical protein LEP1GSC186_0960 [Leptospira noguchii serovar Autumnalis str. ZUN142]|uniref:Transposase DDE domain protein n=1 Tax=Leptospira noguchii serovar Autumnalis str. ZUN142 TaxID=1085540 RepID=M6UB87_9LEPT|nr:hypothetical protein LEP1GSC186_0960 [Leptospira noguchii serovar Autumnalis str. ZUN142]
MIRNFLKGKEGDRINAIFAATGFNFSKLIRVFLFLFYSYLAFSFLFSI